MRFQPNPTMLDAVDEACRCSVWSGSEPPSIHVSISFTEEQYREFKAMVEKEIEARLLT